MFTAIEMLELARTKRTRAVRARRWAAQIGLSPDRDRLLLHAAELEAEATDLEQQARSQT